MGNSTEWFSASELTSFDGLPSSEQGINKKARKENWIKRKREGIKGGKAIEYHYSSLPIEVQKTLGYEDALYQAVAGEPTTTGLLWGDDSTQNDEISTNINQEINKLKELTGTIKNTELAKALGIAPNTIQNWRIKKAIPKHITEKANRIAKGEDFEVRIPRSSIPYYDVDASCGAGTLVPASKEKPTAIFSKEFVTSVLGFSIDTMYTVTSIGHSMEPTIQHNAILAVQKVDKFINDGIYLFKFDDQLMVKRLQYMKGGLKVISDNSTFDPWEITKSEMESYDFEILGEVKGVAQKI